MVISKIYDGFGNQLFMYSCGYAVAKRLNQKLLLDASLLDNHKTRQFELHHFNIQTEKTITYQKLKFLPLIKGVRLLKDIYIKCFFQIVKDEHQYKYLSAVEGVSGNVYLHGHWQSEKYFKPYRKDLLSQLQPKATPTPSVQALIDQFSSENAVAVHVRRGDYLNLGVTLSMDYYDNAIQEISTLVQNPVFYVFSDDISFCKQSFEKWQDSVTICYPTYESPNPVFDDLWLMSKCKHNIIANSTYSWWSAWLNQNDKKIVMRPKTTGADTYEFYPEEWLQIETKR